MTRWLTVSLATLPECFSKCLSSSTLRHTNSLPPNPQSLQLTCFAGKEVEVYRLMVTTQLILRWKEGGAGAQAQTLLGVLPVKAMESP